MTIQWILQTVASSLVGCIIGFFLLRIFTKIRVFLIRKSSKFIAAKEQVDKFNIKRFYNTFGFYYKDVIKYAPELDEFIANKLRPELKDNVQFKMSEMIGIYNVINEVEQIDIIKFKQTIENIKNQKTLENID